MGTHAIQVPGNTPCRHCGEAAKAPVQRLQASHAFAAEAAPAAAETAGAGFGHDFARVSVRPPAGPHDDVERGEGA
jgi:hypothetical protein